MKVLGNKVVFVIAYVVLMIPTYILPYFGSNSSVVGALSLAVGLGPTPQWWVHVWFLSALTLIGWVRGVHAGRTYLSVFPALAAVFDMVPGLSMIPLVPTIMHLLATVLGVMEMEPKPLEEVVSAVQKKALRTMIVFTVVAIVGIAVFVTSKTFRDPFINNKKETPDLTSKTKVPPTASVAPKPTPTPAPVVPIQSAVIPKPAEPSAAQTAPSLPPKASAVPLPPTQPAMAAHVESKPHVADANSPKRPAHAVAPAEIAKDKTNLRDTNAKLDELLKN